MRLATSENCVCKVCLALVETLTVYRNMVRLVALAATRHTNTRVYAAREQCNAEHVSARIA